jgi:hypothetical protein
MSSSSRTKGNVSYREADPVVRVTDFGFVDFVSVVAAPTASS